LWRGRSSRVGVFGGGGRRRGGVRREGKRGLWQRGGWNDIVDSSFGVALRLMYNTEPTEGRTTIPAIYFGEFFAVCS